MGWRERSHWGAFGLSLTAIILLQGCDILFTVPGPHPRAQTAGLAALPLTFEANVGQADSRYPFAARGPGYRLLLNGGGAMLHLNGRGGGPASVKVSLEGANPS